MKRPLTVAFTHWSGTPKVRTCDFDDITITTA